MGTKITKELTLEQGTKDYYMVTSDFGSLQMRLACQDTSLNSSGIDKNLYDLYKEDSAMADAHCMTGWSTFCNSVNYQLIEIEAEDGTIHKYGETQEVPIIRNGNKIKVMANNLIDTDELDI